MRHWIMGLSLVGGLGLWGCSKSSPPTTKATSPTSNPTQTAAQPAAKPIAVPASATPEQVVTVFLHALRSGDSPTTESLLTAKARQELARHEMHVDVQAAPNALYQVEPAQVMPSQPTVAHVNSLWTEKYQNELDQPVEERYGIVWGLRQQPEGWRVAGMQVELVPGLPQYLDFENPEDMLKKREEALAALQPSTQPSAQQPTVNGQQATAASAIGQPAAQTAQQPQFQPVTQQPRTIDR